MFEVGAWRHQYIAELGRHAVKKSNGMLILINHVVGLAGLADDKSADEAGAGLGAPVVVLRVELADWVRQSWSSHWSDYGFVARSEKRSGICGESSGR